MTRDEAFVIAIEACHQELKRAQPYETLTVSPHKTRVEEAIHILEKEREFLSRAAAIAEKLANPRPSQERTRK